MNPRMQITWSVLEAALDAGDEMVIAACRRIITANIIGWRKHGSPVDYRLVLEFYERLFEAELPDSITKRPTCFARIFRGGKR